MRSNLTHQPDLPLAANPVSITAPPPVMEAAEETVEASTQAVQSAFEAYASALRSALGHNSEARRTESDSGVERAPGFAAIGIGSGASCALELPGLLSRGIDANPPPTLGITVLDMPHDGSCAFYAISHQLSSVIDKTLSAQKLRQMAVEYVQHNQAQFVPYMGSSVEHWAADMSLDSTWVDHIALQAVASAEIINIVILHGSGGQPTVINPVLGCTLVSTSNTIVIFYTGAHYQSVTHLDSTNEALTATVRSLDILLPASLTTPAGLTPSAEVPEGGCGSSSAASDQPFNTKIPGDLMDWDDEVEEV